MAGVGTDTLWAGIKVGLCGLILPSGLLLTKYRRKWPKVPLSPHTAEDEDSGKLEAA